MKNRLILLLLLVPCSMFNVQCSMAQAQQFVEDSLKVDGNMRRFDLFLPEGIKTDALLVFYLHGYGGRINRDNPMIETASREGFAVCIPQGLKDPKGKPSWNVGYPFQDGWKVDDVKSLCKMAAYVQKRYHLSHANTFLTGMSNGGEMSYLMAYSKQKNGQISLTAMNGELYLTNIILQAIFLKLKCSAIHKVRCFYAALP